MVFKITHLFFNDTAVFTEGNPPNWMLHKENVWWWEGYVLKLDIGESIKSDFNKIERIG